MAEQAPCSALKDASCGDYLHRGFPSPEARPDHVENMIQLYPDLSINKLNQAMELGDRLFPPSLNQLEARVKHLQAEGLWNLSELGILASLPARQKIVEIFKYVKTSGLPNAGNYMRIRLAKVQFTTHVLNCIEASIRNPRDRQHPAPRKSLVRDAIFRYQQGHSHLLSYNTNWLMLICLKLGRETAKFTETQMRALVSYVSATRPYIISFGSKLKTAVKHFLTYHQLPARPTVDEIRSMIGIQASTTASVDQHMDDVTGNYAIFSSRS
ncbi:hypothetical protein N7462_001812 [Penicillium macrosclerotiorum]|uniref:uncharacterized protein n=1 Tax=Penicillium macrosclerotiorum TaxID=303699 RepID=UPI00254860F7|nr:uncharacterized protein N7462_001812 [Penicillium macrosclerotiorum]KAJ5692389.1 hypothetical protein N7462_001812 [Penicillium macrosclerotiorum]